jgi:hypothetical protein
MHLNKNGGQSAKNRFSGSIAYVGAARSAWLVAEDEEDPQRKKLLNVKSNLGPKPDGLAYTVQNNAGSPALEWEPEPLEESADQAQQTEDKGEAAKREAAKEYLEVELRDGPRPAKELQRTKDFGRNTLFEAKKELGITAKKGSDNATYWHLPEY